MDDLTAVEVLRLKDTNRSQVLDRNTELPLSALHTLSIVADREPWPLHNAPGSCAYPPNNT